MKGRRGLAANAASLMVAELVSKVANFLLIVVLARGLGPREYGHFAFAFAFLPLFLHLARFGVDVATVRRVSAEPDAFSATFVNAGIVRTTLAAAAVVVALGLTPLFVDGNGTFAVVAVLGIALFLDDLGIFLSVGFTAAEQMHLHARVVVVNRVVSTLLAGLVVAAGGGLMAVCVAYAAGSFGAVLIGALLFKRRLPPVRASDAARTEMGALLRHGAPFGIAAFLNMAVFRLDAVLLQAMKGPAAVGLYGVAYRFFEPLLFVTWTISHAATPRLVREATEHTTSRTFELCMAAILAFYVPIAAGAPFVAEWLTHRVFGDGYLAAVDAVVWLTTAAVPYALAHLLRSGLIASGERRSIVVVAGVVLSANISLNLLLIPAHGVTGAATATFITETLGFFCVLVLYVRRVAPLRPTGALVAPVAAAAVMALALWPLPRGGPALALGVVVYCLALTLALVVLAREDAGALVKFLRSRLARVSANVEPHA